jgi:ATP-dependent Clp protease ATP-binding subunit ClpC
MPTIHRFPVLVWQDHQGGWTARLVDRDEPAGFGSSASQALDQLHDYLVWDFGEYTWQDGPDFVEPEVLFFEVQVRPEYQQDGLRFPCDEQITLRVPAVRGRQQHGLFICALPTLDLRFFYHEAGALRNLVTHYVQQKFEAVTPQEIARYLPPVEARLDWIVITVRARKTSSRFASSNPTLASIAEALGDPTFRRGFSRPYERDRQVNDLVRRLTEERANVLLVGDPGCGKTTTLVEAVKLLERSEPDKQTGRSSRRYWQTSAGRLIAGMKYLGQWEERCEDLIAELSALGGVLCVEGLLDLVRLGGASPTNSLAAFFLPYLQRGELRMVGEVTPAELDACRRLLPGLVDVFQLLALPAFSRQEAITVLEHVVTMLSSNLHLEVGRGVVAQVYHLFRRFQPYGAFPGKAVAFLQSLFDGVRQQRRPEVTTDHVLQAFIRQTGLPELFLRDELPLSQEDAQETFRRQIIGQEEAIHAATSLVTTFKAGMNDPGRPVGVLLFSGPTGVGKTEMARALARFFFGHGEQGDRLVRLDMSEYTGWRAGERLVMTAERAPSKLIQKVRQQPFLVVLLDEIEKADPEVFDVLLGVFDEGRLTDRFGRVTSFQSAVIIMTSNLGAGQRQAFGFGKQVGVDYEGEAMAFFRPEFFNRIDQIVTFEPLSAETIRAITRKELTEIAGREGIQRAGVKLTWSERLEAHLVREGFDERYGARPLQRTLEALVVTPLARYLIDHPQAKGTTLHVDVNEQGSVEIKQRGNES